jgi:hypothetical protein
VAPRDCRGASVTDVSDQDGIDALAGCEALFGLQVYGALDLRPLAALRRIGEGALTLGAVASLDGLEALEETPTLHIDGVALRSLRPLLALRRVDNVQLSHTGLVDLSGFEHLDGVRGLLIDNNDELRSLDGLVVARKMTALTLSQNAALVDATALRGLRDVATFSIMGNSALTQLPDFEQLVHLDALMIVDNAALQAAPAFPLLTSIGGLDVRENAALQLLTGLATLQTASFISIRRNPKLATVDLSQLQQAGPVFIVDNAGLDGSLLSSRLASVESSLLRVAPDQTQSLLSPCPWAADDVCDERYLCAPDTDPICH